MSKFNGQRKAKEPRRGLGKSEKRIDPLRGVGVRRWHRGKRQRDKGGGGEKKKGEGDVSSGDPKDSPCWVRPTE